MSKQLKLLFIISIFICTVGCRGWKSEQPPIHPNINFDFQPKIKAQRNPLPVPQHTIQYNATEPKQKLRNYTINDDFMALGRKNYNIYCSSCHTKTGIGTKSIISQNGWIVSNILEDVTYYKSDGELYKIIDNGVRSMPGYGNKLDDKDMWAIVLYVRALQKMSRVTQSDVNHLKKLESK